jgi:iron complex outermembrane receptor protein
VSRLIINSHLPGMSAGSFRKLLLATACLIPLFQAMSAAAQVPASSYKFSIPAQPLSSALVRFSSVTGIDVLFNGTLPAGARTQGLSGSASPEEALGRLLAGSGLSWRFQGTSTVVLTGSTTTSAAASSGSATELAPIILTSETAWGPVDGFVATRSATGTKTDTPLIETPQSISVITRDQMDVQGVNSLNSALRYTPGASGDLYGTDNRGLGVQLRGMGTGNSGVFYRDGLQLKDSNFAMFNAIEPYGAERYEVLRGPASVLYGQATPGGLVNYVSKRPTEEVLREVEIVGGSFEHYEGRFDFGGPVGNDDTLFYRMTGVVRDSSTQIDFVDDDRLFLVPAITFKPDEDTKLTVLGQYQRDRSGWAMQYLPASGTVSGNRFGKIPNSRFVGEPAFDEYNNTLGSVGYEFEHHFNDAWQIRQNARYVWLTHEEQGVFGAGLQADGRSYDRYADGGGTDLQGGTIDTQIIGEFDTGELAHTLLAGIDFKRHYYRDYASSGDVATLDIFDPVYGSPIGAMAPYRNTETVQSQLGIYGQDQIKLDRWTLTLGGRYDWAWGTARDAVESGNNVNMKDDAFTGRAGLVYLTDNGLAPYVSYTESFNPITQAGFEPETGRQYEVGIKYQPPGSNSFMTVSAFDLARQNVVSHSGPGGATISQTGEITSRGIELEGVASLDSGLDVRLAYTYLDTEVTKETNGDSGAGTSDVGKTPFGVARHRVSLWADYQLQNGPLEGLTIGGGVRYVGKTWGDDANTFKVPSYVLADAALSYKKDNTTLSLNVSNIFDKDYVASCFADGFGCFYGEGRRITASVRVTW